MSEPADDAPARIPSTGQDTRRFVAWVRAAAPYVHAFGGRTFVIAFGGEISQRTAFTALAQDINLLAALGIRLVLVHGARPQIEAELRRRGLPGRYHRGQRVTDAEALECVKAAMGALRIELEAQLSQGLPNTPMAGAYMRVTSGNFVVAKPVGVMDGVDYQYTGAVRKVIAEEIAADLDQENVVLISPLGVSPSGEIFNLSMEEVAEAVAVAIRADKLVFLCSATGLTDAKGQVVSALTADQAERLSAGRADLPEDVSRCVACSIRAARGGVGRSHLIDREVDGALLLELFTHEGIGTVITRDALARLREATIDDVAAIVQLIKPLEDDGTLVRRSREQLEMEIDRFSLLDHDGFIVGCAALYPFSDEHVAELACLAVQPEHRRVGHGDALLQHIEARARAAGIARIFVLTTRTAHWFVERGFVETDVDSLPGTRRQLYNYQRRSKVLVKTL